MRQGIATLADGTYRDEFLMDQLDDAGKPVKLVLTVRIEGDELYADFTGTSGQVRRPINDPLNHVRAWLVVGLYAVVAPNMPN